MPEETAQFALNITFYAYGDHYLVKDSDVTRWGHKALEFMQGLGVEHDDDLACYVLPRTALPEPPQQAEPETD